MRIASCVVTGLLLSAGLSASAEVKGVRYLRFWVYETRSTQSTTYGKQNFYDGNVIGDFRPMKGGVELDWPDGTVCTYDNVQGFVQYGSPEVVSTTAVLDKSDGCPPRDEKGSINPNPYVKYAPRQQMFYQIALPEGTSIDFEQFAIYRGYETRAQTTSPATWSMEVSANGTDWFPVDFIRGYVDTPRFGGGIDFTCYGWYGAEPYPYYVSEMLGPDLDLTGGQVALASGSLVYHAVPNAVRARKLRWTVGGVVAGTSFNVREFAVALGGVRLPRHPDASVTSAAAGSECLFDGDTATAWAVTRDFAAEGALVAEIDLGEVAIFDGYDLCFAGTTTVSSDTTPTSWTLEAQDPETGLWHRIAAEDAESLGVLLTTPNLPYWRSDYSYADAALKGQMFHLSVAGTLPKALARTAAAFSGAELTASAGTTIRLADAEASLAPGSTIAGELTLDNGVLGGVTAEGVKDATISGSGVLSYAADESVAIPENADYAVGSDTGVLTPEASFSVQPNKAFRFLRYRVFQIGAPSGATNVYSTSTGLSELELLDENGDKVFWPEGTKAYCSNAAKTAVPGLIEAKAKLPQEGTDREKDSKPNRIAAGMPESEARQDTPGTLSSYCASMAFDPVEAAINPPAFIIELGDSVSFATYRLFATYNCQGYHQCPLKIALDASLDGVNWYTLDSKDFLRDGWNMSVNLDHLLFYTKTIDWTAVKLPPADRIADDTVLVLGADKTMTLGNAVETVGGIAGTGTVIFTGAAPGLTLNGRDESQVFSGAFEGAGVLTVNAGVNVFEDVDLSGVTEIVLKPGACLKGTAWTGGSLKVSGGGIFGLKLTAGAVRFDEADVSGVPGDGLAAVAVTGSGRVSFAPGKAVQLPADWPETLTIGGDNGAYTPASSLTIRPSRAFKFLRLRALDIGYGATKSANFEISELDILDANGDKVFWPEGTVAYRSDGNKTPAMQLIDSPAKLPNEGPTQDQRYDNRIAAGWTPEEAEVHCNTTMFDKTVATWVLPSVDDVANGPAFIIELGAPVAFETYRLFATYNCIGYARCLQHFTFDASFDGENWFTLDEGQYGTKESPWCGANLDHLMFHKRTIDWDACVPHAATDRIADDAAVDLGDGVALNVVSATETVGGLAGAGSVALGGADPVLVLAGVRGDLAFSGAVSGAGTLVLEAGTNAFDDADLSGVTNLILRAGAVVLGTARTTGDLAVVSEGGEWGASFSVGGTLTLGGDPLRLPFDVTTGAPCSLTAFSYGTTDASSTSLFLSSVVEKGPWERRRSFDLRATDSAMTFRVERYGMLLLFK